MNKIRNEEGEITTDPTEIHKIIKEYYEQLHWDKLDNLEEMKKFLEIYSLPRLSQEERDNLNRLITRSEIEFVIKNNSQKRKVQDWRISQGNSTKQIKKNEYISYLFPKSFYEAITLIAKTYKDTIKQNYRPVSLMNTDAKIFNKILTNQIQQYVKKRLYAIIKLDLFQDYEGGLTFSNQPM